MQKDLQWMVDNGLAADLDEAYEMKRSSSTYSNPTRQLEQEVKTRQGRIERLSGRVEAGDFGSEEEFEELKQQLAEERNLLDQAEQRLLGGGQQQDSRPAPSRTGRAPQESDMVGNPDPTAGADGPVQISNDEEFNSLPSGATFVGPDGVVRRKP